MRKHIGLKKVKLENSRSGIVSIATIIAIGVVTIASIITAVSVKNIQQEQNLQSEAATACSNYSSSSACGAVPGCNWKAEQKSNCSSFTNAGSCSPTGCSWHWDNCSLDDCPAGCNHVPAKWEDKTCTMSTCFAYSSCSYKASQTIKGYCSGPAHCAGKSKSDCELPSSWGCGWTPDKVIPASCSGTYRVQTQVESCSGQANKRCEGQYVSVPGKCEGTPIVSPTPTPTPVNKCTSGNSYCQNGSLYTCKSDKSGYTQSYCGTGKYCPSGGTSCVTQPTPTPTPTPTPPTYTCTTKGGSCYTGPSNCGALNRSAISGTCAGVAICCGALLPTDQCTKGNSYCQDNKVYICKADKSGYTSSSCPSGKHCPANGIGCVESPNTCLSKNGACFSGVSNCGLVQRTAVAGTCSGGSICCSKDQVEIPNNCTKGNSYCEGNKVYICKSDKSGYTNSSCPSGKYCPSGGAGCITQPTPTPTPTSPTYTCTSKNGDCHTGPSNCGVLNRTSIAGGTCPGIAICCSKDQIQAPNNCIKGNSYCQDNKVYICKADKSGYNVSSCPSGKYCPANGAGCVNSPNTCLTNGGGCFSGVSSCSVLSRTAVTGTCNPGAVCCSVQQLVDDKCDAGNSYCDVADRSIVLICKPDKSGYTSVKCNSGYQCNLTSNACAPIENKCTKGNSYCQNGSLFTCRADKSGYTQSSCGTGKYCPSGGTACTATIAEVLLANGKICSDDSQCASNNCQFVPGSRICALRGDSIGQVGLGGSCGTTSYDRCEDGLICSANKCVTTNKPENSECKSTVECASGLQCQPIPGGISRCVKPTTTAPGIHTVDTVGGTCGTTSFGTFACGKGLECQSGKCQVKKTETAQVGAGTSSTTSNTTNIINQLGSNLDSAFGSGWQVNVSGMSGSADSLIMPRCGDPDTPECEAEWDEFIKIQAAKGALYTAAAAPYWAPVAAAGAASATTTVGNAITGSTWAMRIAQGWGAIDTALDALDTVNNCAINPDPGMCGQSFTYAAIPGANRGIMDLLGGIKNFRNPAIRNPYEGTVEQIRYLENKYGKQIGGGIYGDVYLDENLGVLTKVFKQPSDIPEMMTTSQKQMEIYEHYANVAPGITFYGAIPEGGFKQQFFGNSQTLLNLQMHNQALTPEEIQQAQSTLAQLHSITGVAHGDLSGNNILVQTDPITGSRTVIFIDYGGHIMHDIEDPETLEWELSSQLMSVLTREFPLGFLDDTPGSVIRPIQQSVEYVDPF